MIDSKLIQNLTVKFFIEKYNFINISFEILNINKLVSSIKYF